ncbi:MAG TPA: TlpA disulfide reductase family protein [Nannocystaceae bacterium]|nr:TlpA disulfide reductase family protein [Nannocystaceae bacterium]
MRTWLLGASLAALACTGGDAYGTKASAGSPKPAPAMVGKTIAGDAFDLDALRGTVVLVNVWATWCAPCREELPELEALHREHAARGFTVIGVSVDRAAALMQVRQMVDSFALSYPIVFDPMSKAIADWDVRGYPTSFLVDRTGVIRWRRDGIIRPEDPELTPLLKLALDTPQ